MEVITLLALGIACIAIERTIRSRREVQRSGMSDAHPVCANCLYPLGGWSSSHCPECGADVAKIGVRIGAQTPRMLLTIIIVLGAFFGVGMFSLMLFSTLFAERSCQWQASWKSLDPPEFHITTTVESEWRRFPPRDTFHARMIFVRLAADSTGSWINGEWKGSTPPAQTSLTFDQDESTAGLEAITNAIHLVAGDTPEALRHQQADDIWRGLTGIRRSAENGLLQDRNYAIPVSSRFIGGSGGCASRAGSHWLAFVCSIIAFVVAVGLPIRVMNRRYKPGWRRVRPDEWAMPRRE